MYICDPTEFFLWATADGGTPTYTVRTEGNSYTVTGDSFTSSRHVYIRNASSAKTLTISVDRNAGVSGTGLIRTKADGTTDVIAPTAVVNDLTIYVITNYGTTYRRVTLSIVNGSTTSDNLNCTLSSTLS